MELLKATFPRVVVYDREEEAARDDSRAVRPRHPEVADIEAIFGRRPGAEVLTLRGRRGHRYLNCTATLPDAAAGLERFLQSSIAAMPGLLE